LLNIALPSGIPVARVGKNNVTIVSVPNPPLDPKMDASKSVTLLMRVKSGEDADELKEKLERYKDK